MINIFRFLFLGEGDAAPLTHEVLRKAVRDFAQARRPRELKAEEALKPLPSIMTRAFCRLLPEQAR